MKIKFLALLIAAACFAADSLYSSNEVGCVCNNKKVKNPKCDICGSDAGTMEQTADGALCMCENNLQSHRAFCADVCEDDGGWSGEFSS